jgi:transcriptional regulator with PAS, ATPase and Fis domain
MKEKQFIQFCQKKRVSGTFSEGGGSMPARTDELERTQRLLNMYATVVDNDYECIVGVDEDSRVIMINQAYCNLLGVKRDDVLGRDVEDVIENTRLHIVLQTGRPEIGEIQRINGHDAVCSRIPIKANGKVWAAVGKVMFRDVSEMRSLMKRVERLQSEIEYYKDELKRYHGTRYSVENIIGDSLPMKNLKALVKRVARNDSTVLIRGESGTGKELFAHALHNASPRAQHAFVKVNCAAVPENLLESELFGYQEGAFTGAVKGGKIGKFELADRGTIFLDEIGDMPLNMQVKLLRVLQEKEIEKLGGNKPIKVDVRIVAATNRNLEEMVKEGSFRGDLFYRLNVIALEIPPLHQRIEDIPLLVDSLMNKLSIQLGCPYKQLAPSALNSLLAHHWPGNVRELENVLERLLNIVEEKIITANHVAPFLRSGGLMLDNKGIKPLKEAVEKLEKTLMLNALEVSAGNCITAAKLLKISKSTFYDKMSKYGITKKIT